MQLYDQVGEALCWVSTQPKLKSCKKVKVYLQNLTTITTHQEDDTIAINISSRLSFFVSHLCYDSHLIWKK